MDIRWAFILATGLILAAFIQGGIYGVVNGGDRTAFRINKFTGEVSWCPYTRCVVLPEAIQ